MRGPAIFLPKQVPIYGKFRCRELLLWVTIFAVQLIGVRDIAQQLRLSVVPVEAAPEEAEYENPVAAELDPLEAEEEETLPSYTWVRLWRHFSTDGIVFAAVTLTLTTEAIASLFTRAPPERRRRRCALQRPIARRFWYQSNPRQSRPLLIVPLLVTLTFVVAALGSVLHLAIWLNASACQDFFTGRNDAGVSLGAMIHLANLLMLVYLLTCLAISLLPETLAPRYERFQLVLCALVSATCFYAFAGFS